MRSRSRSPSAAVLGGQRHRGRQARRDFVGEGRAGQHRDRRVRAGLAARPRAAARRSLSSMPLEHRISGLSQAGARSSTARMCCAGVTTSQASQLAELGEVAGRADRADRAACPARKTGFSWRALTASTTSGSSAHSRVSRPPAAATWASAVPQAPPPITPSSLMPSPPRRAPSRRFGRAASARAPARRARRSGPAAKRSAPAQAIIAALSVHSQAGGTLKRRPCSLGELGERGADRAGWRRRRRRRPAPARRSARARAAVRSTRQSTTACWKLAAMSSRRDARPTRPRAAPRSSGRRRRNAARPSRPAGAAAAPPSGSPSFASASIAGPPG